ncbi:cell shape-determining protein MreC [Alicyclobacillus cellulosilyticus]|uniref:Cell shape-determining protein MreC n=1 Tax=Alicyclobacillus cellulosilyticus TaxID=1003997 RepID=A0A917NGL3_9BACL|nr:cell shape-determining protein MreC [Alicyclobacillus cellulosilyticus]
MRVSRLFSNRTLFVLLASFVLLTAMAGLTLRSQAALVAWPERVILDIQNAVGALIYRPVSQVSGFLAGIRDLRELYIENAQLKAQLRDYAWLQVQLRDVEAENRRLKQMLGFKSQQGAKYATVPAHVIGRDPSQWNAEVTIDVGRRQGVREDMAVISADGSLVGRIALAGAWSSKVVLITDTQQGDGVSAKVQNGSAEQPFGIVLGANRPDNLLDMEFLSPLANVKPGDTVVTSGLSSVFPPGLLIGTVVRVQPGLQGLTQRALVRPAADLDYLQDVFVVTSPRGGTGG